MKTTPFESLLRNVEDLKTLRDEAVGSVKEITKQLKEEFGVPDLDQAQQKLDRIKEKYDDVTTKYRLAVEQFNKTYEMDVVA